MSKPLDINVVQAASLATVHSVATVFSALGNASKCAFTTAMSHPARAMKLPYFFISGKIFEGSANASTSFATDSYTSPGMGW